MTDQVKVQAYQEAYELLGTKKEVTNLYYPEEKRHLDFRFNISDVECYYSLNSKTDMLRLEAVKLFEGLTEIELAQKSEEYLKDTNNIRSTFYDNKIKFQSNIIFTGVEDPAAKSMIDEAFADFVAFVIANFYVEPIEEEPTEEELLEEEIEKEIEEGTKTEPVVYNTTEFEDVDKVMDFNNDFMPERQSKNVHDIKFPILEDIPEEEVKENTENNAFADIFKDFKIPEINTTREFNFQTPEPPVAPMPNPYATGREADLEARERNLYLKTQELEKKEMALNAKNDEIQRLYLNIEPQKKEIEARYAQLQKDADALMKAKTDLEERAKQLSQQTNTGSGNTKQVLQLQEYIKQLKANASNYEKDIENYENALKQLQSNYEVLKVDSNNKIETLNNRVVQLQNENIENVAKGNQENERLTGIIEEKNQDITRLENEIEDLRNQIKEKEEEIAANTREVDRLQKELSEVPMIMPIQKVKQNLSEEGIEMEIVAGEGGDILMNDNYNGCKIVVNCNLTIFYIKKDIKKAIRYTSQINTYNEEDIRYTYVIGNENIACKGIYQDIVPELKACLEKFDSFKAQ